MKIGNDGYAHRTAWAATGNAVLFYDPTNSGQISQANQVIFTDWDPTAKSDMQALLDVFDTNHDGKLDAGDAGFASFRLMVTNADGTTSVETLAQAGITSINLIPSDTFVQQVDGSTVTGQTTYTKSNGTTGAAADVTLAVDANGYVVKQTVTHNSDGSTTIDNKALNSSGDLANETILTTSTNGLSKTLTYDSNGDGTIDGKQTDVTVTNADGSTTETLSDYGFGGSSLIDSFATTTSADGKTITIKRDFTGGGIVQQVETRVTNADGSTSDTISNVNGDGSLVSKVVVGINAAGLVETTQHDKAGSGTYNLTTTDTTVVNNDGSRTETIKDANGDGSLRDQSVTTTSSTGQSKTVKEDHSGSGTFDLAVTSTTVTNADGSDTTTVKRTNADGSLRGEIQTSYSSDGLVKIVQLDLDGDGNADRTTNDTTTVDASGNRTETVTIQGGDGTLLSKSVTVQSADGITRTVTTDANGDGNTDTAETVAVGSGGVVTDTVSLLNPDGSSVGKTVTTTSANGLSKTTQEDHTGNGTFDLTVSDVVTQNTGGGSTETVTQTNANGSSRGKTVTTTTADDLTKTTQVDLDGDGAFDRTTTDATAVNGDGSRTETVTLTSNNGTLLGKTITTTSADRRTTTITVDGTGDGKTTASETITTANNGTVTDTVSNLNADGSLINKSMTTTSANGLSVTTQTDRDGNGSFDLSTTDVTTLNGNGSTTEVVTDSNNDGSVRDKTTTTTSGNGLSRTTAHDYDGNGTTDLTTTDVTALNNDGSATETVSDANNNGSLRDATVITVSGNGLSRTVTHDFDGDGKVDLTTTDAKVLNSDGSTSETITDTNANGMRDKSVTTTSADGKTTISKGQFYGSVAYTQDETRTEASNGSVADAVFTFAASGKLLRETLTTTSANGLGKTIQTDVDGDGHLDLTTSDNVVLNADGSRTETVSETGTGGSLIAKTVTTTSGTGLSVTTQADQNGDGTVDLTTTDVSALGVDGGTTETVTRTNADGSIRGKTVTVTSADRRTVTVTRTLGTDGTQGDVSTVGANGTVTETISSKNATGAIVGGKTVSTTANGLSRTTTFTNASGTAVDTATDAVTLNANGSRTEHYSDADGATTSDMVATTSVNGLVKTSTLKLNGSTSYSASDVTVVNADGSNTETLTDTIGSATADKLTISLSADALVKTFSLDETGGGTVDITDTTALATDGSKTETLVALNTATNAQQQKDVITTSADGRTTTLQSARNGDTAFDHFETTVINADGSVSDSNWVTNSTNAPNYQQTRLQASTPDGGQRVTITDMDGNGVVEDRTVSSISADGLSKSYATQTIGSGTADLTRTDVTVLNADGSTTETIQAVGSNGSSLANGGLLYRQVITTSADGLTVTTQVDNDGNGVYESKDVVVTGVDGSTTSTVTHYNNVSGAAVGFTASDGSVTNSLVETTSANGLVRIQTEGTLTDTTMLFADANGSYQWAESTTAHGAAQTLASASHVVDGAKVDTWTYTPSGGSAQAIRLDLAAETRDLGQAEGIYQAVLGRAMQDNETQALVKYISGGVLNQASLTNALLGSTEFTQKYGSLGNNFLIRAEENVFGRLPAGTDLSTFLGQLSAGTTTMAAAVDAIVQKAQDEAGGNGLLQLLANAPIGAVTPISLLPVGNTTLMSTGTTYEAFVASFPAPNGNLTQSQISSFETLVYGTTSGLTTNQGSNVFTATSGSTTDRLFYGTGTTIDAAASGLTKLVDVGSGNTLKATSGSGILLAGGTSDILFGGSGSSSLYAIGNNEQVTTGTGATSVFVQGSGVSVNAGSGTSNIGIVGANATVTGGTSKTTIDVGGTGASFTGTGSTISVESGATATISGSGDVITSASSAGVTLNASSSTLNGYDSAAMTIAGNSNTVNADAGSTMTVTGTSETINAVNSTILLSGGASATVKGAGNVIVQQGGSTLTAVGESDYVEIKGAVGTDTLTGALVTVDASANVSGNNDVLDVNAASVNLGLSGSNDVVNVAQGQGATVTSADGTTVKEGSNGTILLSGGVSLTSVTFVAGVATITENNGDKVAISGVSNQANLQYTDAHGNVSSTQLYEGTAGNDSINVPGSNITFDLGKGNDYITHQNGQENDVYVYQAGDGNDVIDTYDQNGTTDVLKLANLNASDLTFSRSGTDLVIGVKSTGETITASGQWYTALDNGLNAIQFADGTSMNRSQFEAAASVQYGTPGNDLYPQASGMTIYTGKGDKTINSTDNFSNETYVYSAWDGNDVLAVNNKNGTSDTLQLANLNMSDVTLSRNGSDLIVGINSTGEQIDVNGQFYNGTGSEALGNNGVSTLKFADGTTLNESQISADAWFREGTGDASMYLPDGNVTAAAGAGNDAIYGGAGNDTFVYAAHDGNLSIYDNAQSSAAARSNTLSFTDLNASDVTLTRNGSDLLIAMHSTGKSIDVAGEFNSVDHDGVQKMQFANGTVWSRTDIASHTS